MSNERQVTLKGNKMTVLGRALKVGDKAPDFKLTSTDMQDVRLADFASKPLVICAVPSIDTPVCQIESKKFNQDVASINDDVVVLFVSLDLPFAQKRWCGAEGLDRIKIASDYKYRGFGEDYGVYINEIALLARSVFVVGRDGNLAYVDYITEVADEPKYDEVIDLVKGL